MYDALFNILLFLFASFLVIPLLWRFVARRRAAEVYHSYGKLWQDYQRKRPV